MEVSLGQIKMENLRGKPLGGREFEIGGVSFCGSLEGTFH